MNRFQHDNIDPTITAGMRRDVLDRKTGINWLMLKKRRAAKHRRHKENEPVRAARSRGDA